MTSHQSPAQKKTVARVMHEFKHGELRRTEDNERRGVIAQAPHEETSTRASLYAEAQRRGIPGRSRMTKAGLRTALLKGQPC